MNTEYVVVSRDNSIIVELTENHENLTALQYSAITRMELIFDQNLSIDSDVVGSGPNKPFDWTSGEYLKLDFGLLPEFSLIATPKRYTVKHIVYSSDHPNGLLWGHLIIIIS